MSNGRFKRTPVHIKLNGAVSRTARNSDDPIVRSVEDAIKEFSYYKVIGEKYSWKYIDDENYSRLYRKMGVNIFEKNKLFLSHLRRIMEAFEITSMWRVAELAGGCVRCLNAEEIVAAGTLARSMIELAVRYGEASNELRHFFGQYPLDAIHQEIISFNIYRNPENKSDSETLEAYVVRLMSGTRIREITDQFPEIEQRNILSSISKLDKKLGDQKFGYSVKPHYDFLCDVAHPNLTGYLRFVVRETPHRDGHWTIREMHEKARSPSSEMLVQEILWAMSFSLSAMNGCFGVFQDLKKSLAARLGRPFPE